MRQKKQMNCFINPKTDRLLNIIQAENELKNRGETIKALVAFHEGVTKKDFFTENIQDSMKNFFITAAHNVK